MMNIVQPYAMLSVSSTDEHPFPIECKKRKRLIDAAIKRVEEMDKVDGGPIWKHHVDLGMRTVMQALETGIETQSWECVAEALVMLNQIEWIIRLSAKYTMEKLAEGN